MGHCSEMTLKQKPGNFQNKSETVRRVGYAKGHPSDTYLVLKLSNNHVVSTHDVKWSNEWKMKTIDLQALFYHAPACAQSHAVPT